MRAPRAPWARPGPIPASRPTVTPSDAETPACRWAPRSMASSAFVDEEAPWGERSGEESRKETDGAS